MTATDAATAERTPENNDLIGWMRKNNRAARAARILVEFCYVVCRTTTHNFQIYKLAFNGTNKKIPTPRVRVRLKVACRVGKENARLRASSSKNISATIKDTTTLSCKLSYLVFSWAGQGVLYKFDRKLQLQLQDDCLTKRLQKAAHIREMRPFSNLQK